MEDTVPYIRKEFRERAKTEPLGSGELNFCITTLILAYLRTNGLSYTVLSEIVGALELAKDEFQRRVVHPYEEQGHVFF